MRTHLRSRISKAVHVFFILACSAGGVMFVGKLFAFLRTLKSEDMSDFAADPIIIYGFVALGFLCLLGWAFLTGQFSDLEAPKHEMMEHYYEREQADIEALEGQGGGRA